VKVEEAEANLEFIENVSKQMVGKVSLAKDLQEFDGDTASAEMLKKIKVDIESSKRELAQIELKHKEQLKKIQADLTQETSQSQVLVESILQTLEHIML
jgi:GTP-dependent phosphoenolpyruvate carboxykinase